mgnify:CR=1 FL=1
MPRSDGTGPTGQGPMTGRGMGYCAMNLPTPGKNYYPSGFAGISGTPINKALPYYSHPTARPFGGMPFRRISGFGRGRGRGRGRRFRTYW